MQIGAELGRMHLVVNDKVAQILPAVLIQCIVLRRQAGGVVKTVRIEIIEKRFPGKKATFEEKLIFIAYSLYTMMELYVTYMYFCFGVILVGKYLWENNKQEDFLGKKLKNARKQESGMD